jgi:hypothetical protein
MLMKFSEWIVQREMLSPVPFPTSTAEKNPYINGKWSTSAFNTGQAKVKKNVVRTSQEDMKANTKQDGFHL